MCCVCVCSKFILFGIHVQNTFKVSCWSCCFCFRLPITERMRPTEYKPPPVSITVTVLNFSLACKCWITKSQRIYLCASAIIKGKLELSEGEVGQRLGALGLSPVGEREVDGREEILHRRRSGWNAVVLSSHATYVGEALDVICPQQLIQSLARRSDISHARKTLRDRGDTLGLGGYIYIWLGAPLPVSSEYQHVHAITTQSQEHSRRSPALPVVLNLRQGQVLAKLVFVSIMQPVSDESSASSSASYPARRLEGETDSLFRFLGIEVLLAELPACCQALMPPQHLA